MPLDLYLFHNIGVQILIYNKNFLKPKIFVFGFYFISISVRIRSDHYGPNINQLTLTL